MQKYLARLPFTLILSGLAITAAQAKTEKSVPIGEISESKTAWTAEEAERYWTPERMRAAKAAVNVDLSLTENSRANHDSAPSQKFNGVPTVGTFFKTDDDERFCTGSVVESPNKNLVITAAHCLMEGDRNKKMVFVPQYHDGQKPFGVFPVTFGHIYMDKRYVDQGPKEGAAWDFTFVGLGPNKEGRQIEEVVGGNRIAINPGYQNKIQLIGYPGDDPQPLTCAADTQRFENFLRVDCQDYRAGTSGSPWLAHFNGKTGDLVGIIGGYETGGSSSDTSYSSYFDEDFKKLYDEAVASHPRQGPAVLPPGPTMRHSKIMVSGYFTSFNHSDMVVVWDDGEVSLYRGNGQGTFDKEITLEKPNGTWKNAVTIAAGNFTGRATYDLIVRWIDGELTLYPDVNEQGFQSEIQLLPPNSLWKNATRMTAGHFSSSDANLNDLIVQWNDGELTLYSDVDRTGLHEETQLQAPNDLWKNARAITSGEFLRGGASDLIVRWVDGELTLYPHVDKAGFHGENILQSPNDTWTNAILITAGAYSDNAYPDDLIVRWVDGEVSLYPDVDWYGLHKEITLVAP